MSKNVTDREVDLEEDEGAGRPSLSDFLALGLRESQRPPGMPRESQRPPSEALPSPAPPSVPVAPVAVEPPPEAMPPVTEATDVGAAADAAPEEPTALAGDAPSLSPGLDPASDESVEDRPSSLRPNVVVQENAPEAESDYVVPVGWFSRERMVLAAVAVALLIALLAWRSSRGSKAPQSLDTAPRPSAPIAHEPLPPPPPPLIETPAPSADMDVQEPGESPKLGGVAAPSDSSAPPGAYGPNVARYPDLPTPVLIQLEKEQQESKETKKSK